MSIWASSFDLEDNPPYAYQGSHVLPSDDDRRDDGEILQLAEIPSHVTRDGRDDQPDDGKPWPWLRLSLYAEDTVLTRDQAAALHAALGSWLDRTGGRAAADALAAEWHRRHQRLEELTVSKGPEAQVAIVEHVRGELIGLRGALGLLLGGKVQDGTADLLGWAYYREWCGRQGVQS
jgi:hypothetical protein